MSTDLENCYRILELRPEASRDDVEQAYRLLVKVWRSDRFTDDPTTSSRVQEKLKQINFAYETICNFRTFGHEMAEATPANSAQQKSLSQSSLKKRLLMILVSAIIISSIKAWININNPGPSYQTGQGAIRRLSHQEIVDMYNERAAKYPNIAGMGMDAWAHEMQTRYGTEYDFSAAFQPRADAASNNN